MVQGQDLGWSPLAKILLFLVTAVAVCLFGAAIGLAIAWAWLSLEGELPLEFSQMPPRQKFILLASALSAAYPSLAFLTIAFIRRTNQISFKDFGLSVENWGRDLALGFLLGSSFVAIMFVFYSLTGLVRFELAKEISWKRWLILSLWICPIVGLTEELVFRSYLLSLSEKWKGRIFAIIFTGLLFWLAHWGQGNVHEPLGAAGTFTMATSFAIARYLTGKIWLPVGLHTGYNWLALSFGGDIGLGFPSLTEFHLNAPQWLVGPPGHVGVLDLAFYLLLLLLIALIAPKLALKKRHWTMPKSEEIDNSEA
ncbi:MAG: CPBP family intramembrane metalloprotease [Armatimonadetes bacterium]|nr:CPBP family intramembrane metalloprotease [Armatimonadota bacterium]MDW8029425.1 CPBP family intramembrane glutamic endopeptidase [Armatimonadota bacterium]